MVKKDNISVLDDVLMRQVDDRTGEVLRYNPSEDPAYEARIQQEEEKGHRYGYGNLNLLDYLVPDQDPNLEYMAQEPEEHTLARYIHNRKKVYTWEQVAIGAGAIATLLGATVATGGAATMFAAIGMGALNAATATALALGAGFAAAGVAFFAGYFAFRTDIKNDVDIEEMLAKRIGRHVAANLEPIIEEPDVNKRQAKLFERDDMPKIGAYGQSYAREGSLHRPGSTIHSTDQLIDVAADAYTKAMMDAGSFDVMKAATASQDELERMTKPGVDAVTAVIEQHFDQIQDAHLNTEKDAEKWGEQVGEAAAYKGQLKVNELLSPKTSIVANQSEHAGMIDEQSLSKLIH